MPGYANMLRPTDLEVLAGAESEVLYFVVEF